VVIDAKLNGLTITDATNMQDKVKMTFPDPKTYRKMANLLDSKKMAFHTYDLEEEKLLKVVIKGICESFEESTIEQELKNLGYPVRRVVRMKRGKDQCPLPMIITELELSDAGRNIYNLDSLLTMRIKIEALRKKTEKGQCHNCQQFGHANRNCHAPPKCVKCGKGHRTETCKRTRETGPATCANCGGPHPANYRGCPVNPNNKNNKPAPPNQGQRFPGHNLARNGPPPRNNMQAQRPAPSRPTRNRPAYQAPRPDFQSPSPAWQWQRPAHRAAPVPQRPNTKLQWPPLSQANPAKQPLLQTPPAFRMQNQEAAYNNNINAQASTIKALEQLIKHATASLASLGQ
jgi:hypothetical protein